MYEPFGINASSGVNMPVFEVHGYVTAMQMAQGIPPPYAPYVSNISSAQALKYFFQNITEDATGTTALRYLQMPDSALTAELGFIDDAQSQIMKGYLGYIAQTFGVPALLKFTIGDFSKFYRIRFTRESSAKEWIFGFDDPLLNTVSPNGQDNKVRAVHSIRDINTIDIDHVPWGTDAQTMLRAGATPYRLKTGLEGVSKVMPPIFRRTDGDWAIESFTRPQPHRNCFRETNHSRSIRRNQRTLQKLEKGKESLFVPTVKRGLISVKVWIYARSHIATPRRCDEKEKQESEY